MVEVCGPESSGKTTLVYAVVEGKMGDSQLGYIEGYYSKPRWP
jgi:nicotinamide riboside kinase